MIRHQRNVSLVCDSAAFLWYLSGETSGGLNDNGCDFGSFDVVLPWFV